MEKMTIMMSRVWVLSGGHGSHGYTRWAPTPMCMQPQRSAHLSQSLKRALRSHMVLNQRNLVAPTKQGVMLLKSHSFPADPYLVCGRAGFVSLHRTWAMHPHLDAPLDCGGVSACRARARHLFGPLLIRSPDPRFLHGPFLVEDMDWPLSGWGYGLAPFQLGIWTSPFLVSRCAFISTAVAMGFG